MIEETTLQANKQPTKAEIELKSLKISLYASRCREIIDAQLIKNLLCIISRILLLLTVHKFLGLAGRKTQKIKKNLRMKMAIHGQDYRLQIFIVVLSLYLCLN